MVGIVLSEGFVKWHRKVFESAIWQNPNDFRLAFALVGLVNWKESMFQGRNGEVIRVPRGSCITSAKTMKKLTRLSRQEIRTSLKHLEKADFLTTKPTNHFTMIHIRTYSKYNDDPNQQVNQHSTSTQPAPNQHLTTIEEGKERKEGEERKKTDTAQSMEGFDEFWKAYPRKVGKGDCKKIWVRLKPAIELQQRILEAVADQKQSNDWIKEHGKFIPHPSTWLNGERWEDEIDGDEQSSERHCLGCGRVLLLGTQAMVDGSIKYCANCRGEA